jgi:hypothetical protein
LPSAVDAAPLGLLLFSYDMSVIAMMFKHWYKRIADQPGVI